MQTDVLNLPTQFDVVIVGSGHAGCEAGLAAARAGCRTLVITPNLDRVGYMPCNPSIGGPGKSHIVAEVDAMGGAMAKVADQTSLHVRMLNTSKGPAVRALRAQCGGEPMIRKTQRGGVCRAHGKRLRMLQTCWS